MKELSSSECMIISGASFHDLVRDCATVGAILGFTVTYFNSQDFSQAVVVGLVSAFLGAAFGPPAMIRSDPYYTALRYDLGPEMWYIY